MYGTVAGADAYHADRGNAAWAAAEEAAREAALVRGSDHVRFRYVANLIDGYGIDFTPTGHDLPIVEEGAYIAAALELATPGFFTRSFTSAEQKVLTGVGSIKWTVTGNASGIYAAMPRSTSIDALFEPYIIDRDADGFMLRSIGRGICV